MAAAGDVCDSFAKISNLPATSIIVGGMSELPLVRFGADGFFASAVVAFARSNKGGAS
jgi:hypothetical protein